MPKPLITELLAAGAVTSHFPPPTADDQTAAEQLPASQLRAHALALPALDESTLRAHFADLLAIESWPGAAVYARAAALPGLAALHPRQPATTVQGALEILHEVARALAAMTGLDRFTLQPPTLAIAERAALLVARAWANSSPSPRNELLAPAGSSALDAASELGLTPRPVERLETGDLDLDKLDGAAGPKTVAVVASWLTPSGALERNLAAAAALAHARGALFCVAAAGLGKLAGHTRLREAEVDVAWLHLGELCPAATGAALGVRSALTEFLPRPLVGKQREGYELDDELPRSIGPLALAPARLADALALYVALRTLGEAGLKERSERLAGEAEYGPQLW